MTHRPMEAIGAECRDPERICEMMERTRFFPDLPWTEIETLSAYFRAFTAGAEAVIFGEGDPGDFLCLVVDGVVEVVKEDHEGKLRVMALADAGKTLGEMALIDGEPRSATARVKEEAGLLLLSKVSHERMGRDHPRLALEFTTKIARLLSRRLRRASGMLVDHLG